MHLRRVNKSDGVKICLHPIIVLTPSGLRGGGIPNNKNVLLFNDANRRLTQVLTMLPLIQEKPEEHLV